MESVRSLVSVLTPLRTHKKPYKGSFRDFVDARLKISHNINDPLDEDGNTLFHLAVIFDEHHSVSLLLQLGIDMNKKNRWGHCAKDLIRFLGRESFYGYIPTEQLDGMDNRDFEDRFRVRYLNHLQFESYEIFTWVLRKTLKNRAKESVKLGNKWSMALFQKELQGKKKFKISLKWISPLIGHGIFAEEDIPALSYIGEYTGLLRRRRLLADQFNHFVFGYVIGPYETPFVIDAQDRGNLIRFVNHSDEPNLTSRWMIYQEMSHVILFSNRFIPKGTQLTYDYGPDYWKKRSMPLDL